MIELSTNAKFRLQTNQKVLFKADFTLDKHFGRNQYITNPNLTLHGDDVMSGSATISDSTSSSGSFDVGSAIINSFNITLNNFDDRFALYDFTDATMKVYLGIPLVDNVTDESSSSQVEWIVKGFYTVDKPTSIGNTIPLTMLDNMSKFERPFKNIGNLGANESIGTYIDYMCNYCGVVLGQNVPHPEWKVKSRPTDENITCLDMIGYIAQINGCYARINRNGYLDFKWYKFVPDIVEPEYDGGSFRTNTTPYSDGVELDGGSFDHTSVNYVEDGVTRQRYEFDEDKEIDGGSFTSFGGFDRIDSFKSYSVGTDRITITGIEFTVENIDKDSTANDNVYLYDKQGNITDSETDRKKSAREYCLSVSGNKLMPYLDNLTTCMSYIADKVCGSNFLSFSVTAISNPKWEAGDSCTIVNDRGDRYDTVITSISYPLNGYITYSCGAESPSENNSSHSSPLTTALASIKNDTQKQITAYDEAVHRLNQLSSNALGFYTTTVKNELDGSKIEYMHDKEELSQSLHAFKMQGDAFLIGERATTDVDFEWKGGVDMSSNAVFRYLVAEGIDASTINVTNLVVGENVTMGEDATISWEQVSDQPDIPTDVSDLTDTSSKLWTTTIANTWLQTTNVYAQNVKAGSVNAENITGTTISGKTFKVGGKDTTTSTPYYGSIKAYDNDNYLKGIWDYSGFKLYGKFMQTESNPMVYITSSENGSDSISSPLLRMKANWRQSAGGSSYYTYYSTFKIDVSYASTKISAVNENNNIALSCIDFGGFDFSGYHTKIIKVGGTQTYIRGDEIIFGKRYQSSWGDEDIYDTPKIYVYDGTKAFTVAKRECLTQSVTIGDKTLEFIAGLLVSVT